MILNVLSITMIFIALLSILLVIWGEVSALHLYKKWGGPFIPEEKTQLENRSYLILLILSIVLVVRMINWPLFYATLQSFISDVGGAMCIFGVTQVKPGLTLFLELLKPINFFLIGGWLILHILDRATKTSPLMRRKLLLLSIIGLLVLIDSVGDVLLMIGIAPESLVSCCTTVTDVAERPSRVTPESIFGPQYAWSLQVLFLITHFTLIVFIGLSLKSKILKNPSHGRRMILGFLFLFSILNAILFLISQIEVFAPSMMRLPFHHCLYCLWQYVPDSLILFSLFILGTFSVGWGFNTVLFGRHEETADLLPFYLRKIFSFALFSLSASIIILIIHLMVD